MTHWVICRYKEKIYAGADKLATTDNKFSELSASGFMPNTRESITVSKLVKYQSGNKSCIITCADKTYLTSRHTGRSDLTIAQILEYVILPQSKFHAIDNAGLLLRHLGKLLETNYIIDSQNSILLGCGFCDEEKSTLAIYDSRRQNPKSVAVIDYEDRVTSVNMNCQVNTVNIEPGWGSSMSMDPVEFAIMEELNDEHMKRMDTVGNEYTIDSIAIQRNPELAESSQLLI